VREGGTRGKWGGSIERGSSRTGCCVGISHPAVRVRRKGGIVVGGGGGGTMLDLKEGPADRRGVGREVVGAVGRHATEEAR
jgi:hypothetical protein